MDKVYDHQSTEPKWLEFWDKHSFFTPTPDEGKKPFTIILPPPNANADLHLGHAMYVVEDILCRFHRMKGFATLWLPGADHAGFETQYVFEKHLAKEDKSRFDYDRDTLYQMIWDFVMKNKGAMEDQLKRLGFSLDWSRTRFTLDQTIVKTVYGTFKKLYDDGLVYKGERLVNYCVKDGTSFSDLEVVYEEKKDTLYFIRYPIKEGGHITVATTRPETMLGDSAVAVNPNDKRYNDLVGKTVLLPLVGREIPIIADKEIQIEFGTGAVKITPAHDPLDFEIGIRHKLERISVIGQNGRILTSAYKDQKIAEARESIVKDLGALALIEKTQDLNHRVGLCYKCKRPIEPLLMNQWFIKTQPLAQKAMDSVRNGEITIVPTRFEKTFFHWLENIRDWNISRQQVWGIQIPAWYCQDCNEITITDGKEPVKCSCGSTDLKQETDVFDTWFSSGQWPFAALGFPDSPDYQYFYPTSVMETGYDILFFWVARMIMLGLYRTGKVPFKTVYLHGLIRVDGEKMSKSKGNVINPLDMVEKYGADALRMALISGTGPGNDSSINEDKIRSFRNFTNKIWNIARYILSDSSYSSNEVRSSHPAGSNDTDDIWIRSELQRTVRSVTNSIETYRLSDGAQALYDFIWHSFADVYIEKTKSRKPAAQATLEYVLKTSLELLHPYMPFITEEIWQKLDHEKPSITITNWPTS